MPGASKDPVKRLRQAANLKPAPPAPAGNVRTLRHGFHSERVLAPLVARYLAELTVEFAGEDDRLLLGMASRLARLDVLLAYEGQYGPILNRRTGMIRPASELAERVTGAMERQLERLERRKADRALAAGVESVMAFDEAVAKAIEEHDGAS